MTSPKEFLAEEVLVEKKVITYRYLSRALKVNVNVAKRALFDFHAAQNAKQAGSLHATYLLYGTKVGHGVSHFQNGEEDIDMDEDEHALPDHSQSESAPTTTITLVAEENLESVLAEYETLDSIHVYSVSPQPMTDLLLLGDTPRQLKELRKITGTIDDASKAYGTIHNSHVRKRQRKGQGPIAAAAASAPAATPSSVFAKASEPKPAANAPGPNSIWNKAKTKEEPKSSATSSKPAAAEPELKDVKKPIAAASSSAAAPPSLKRASSSGGGGIMQAFAKGASAAKPKKREPVPPPPKKPAAAEEDVAMGMSDDGGDDDNDDDVIPKAQEIIGGKSRQQRQEELRKMMEEDDSEDEKDSESEKEREDTPMEDVEEAKPAAPAAPAKDEGPSEVVTASAGDGRRRGKRRVTRKKMIEDKDGYLVTIQEQGWESFSEDEAPPKPKPAPAAAAPAPAEAKSKKPAPKGQGSIMSFFGKK